MLKTIVLNAISLVMAGVVVCIMITFFPKADLSLLAALMAFACFARLSMMEK